MIIEPIYNDLVVAEIHAIRGLLLNECNGDIDEYRRRVRQHQELSGRRIISRPFRERTERGSTNQAPAGALSDDESSASAK